MRLRNRIRRSQAVRFARNATDKYANPCDAHSVWLSRHDDDSMQCRHLLLAILARMLEDARTPIGVQIVPHYGYEAQTEGRAWFLSDETGFGSFRFICDVFQFTSDQISFLIRAAHTERESQSSRFKKTAAV